MGLTSFWHRGFHQVFLIVVPLVALLAFIPGWRLHRDARVWYWGGTGVICLAIGVWLTERSELAAGGHLADSQLLIPQLGLVGLNHDLLITIIGGICLIRAHLLNRKLCVCCAHDHAH